MRTAASGSLSPRTLRLAALALLTALVMAILPASAGVGRSGPDAGRVSVIVRTTPDAGSRVEALVGRLGGVVGRRIAIINGFAASVPASSLARLQGAPGVVSVTANQRVSLQTFTVTSTPSGTSGRCSGPLGCWTPRRPGTTS